MNVNHRKIAFDFLVILTVIVVFQPVKNEISNLMNLPSDWAYLGPIFYFLAAFLAGFIIGDRIQSIYKKIKTK